MPAVDPVFLERAWSLIAATDAKAIVGVVQGSPERKAMKGGSPNTARVIAPPPVLLAATLILGLSLHAAIPISLVSDPRGVIRFVGVMSIAFGAGVSAAVVRAFRAAATPVSPGRATMRVVRTGPYRYSRNTDYVGQVLVYLGATLLANTWWPMFLAPFVIVAIQRGVVRREERYFEATFGREYRDYSDRVPRWLWRP